MTVVSKNILSLLIFIGRSIVHFRKERFQKFQNIIFILYYYINNKENLKSPFFLIRKRSFTVPHPPQFNTKGSLLFSPQNPSVEHRKTLSSTHPPVPHIPQFHTPLSSTPPSVQHSAYQKTVSVLN